MKPEQYIRHVDGANTAILFVHGILGTPDHFKPFLPFVPTDWSVYNMLLKGHGGRVKDFSAASMAAWKQQVHDAVRELLETNDRIVIVAHSMGTLFAIQEAVNAPVAALFLMNVPLKIRIRFRLFQTSWRVFRGNIKPDDVVTLAAQKACGIEQDGHILRYLGWIPRYLELFAEIKKTRRFAQKLTAPSQVYLSLEDEMVSPKSGRLFEQNLHTAITMLNTSMHFYYSPEDQQRVQEDFRNWIQKLSDG